MRCARACGCTLDLKALKLQLPAPSTVTATSPALQALAITVSCASATQQRLVMSLLWTVTRCKTLHAPQSMMQMQPARQ